MFTSANRNQQNFTGRRSAVNSQNTDHRNKILFYCTLAHQKPSDIHRKNTKINFLQKKNKEVID